MSGFLLLEQEQTRIYMCCQWVQIAGIFGVLWPYGLECSLWSVTKCLGFRL